MNSTCPSCRAPYPSGTNFCTNCGASLGSQLGISGERSGSSQVRPNAQPLRSNWWLTSSQPSLPIKVDLYLEGDILSIVGVVGQSLIQSIDISQCFTSCLSTGSIEFNFPENRNSPFTQPVKPRLYLSFVAEGLPSTANLQEGLSLLYEIFRDYWPRFRRKHNAPSS